MKVDIATMPPPPRVGYEVMIYVRQETRTVELVPNSTAGVGRGADNVIRVEDPSVSRHHAVLHVGDTVQVEDLGSANGTMLVRSAHAGVEDDTTGGSSHAIPQGERVTLEVGDVLRVGQVVLVLQRKGRTSFPPPPAGTPGQPVLVDPEMRRAYELLKRAAATEISVLLLGETGAGKEVMAETVHRWSLRSEGPFLKLNCAALTDTLLESELFGHERGSFTGAHAAKEGLLESTDGGTVFLDEIGEISAGLQAKLLRVQQGHFRSDLYYRISGLVIRIPPLRQRPSEIEPLARHFLREFSMRNGQPMPTIAASALGKLLAHDWPGNVRELRNVMERATLLVTGSSLEAEHVMIENHQADSTDLFDAEFEAETAVMTSPFLESASPEDEKARILKA